MASKPLGSLLYIVSIIPFFLLEIFNHAWYPQFQSLSTLVTVLVAFAYIFLGLFGVPSGRIWGMVPLGWGWGLWLRLNFPFQLVIIYCCISVISTILFLPWNLDTAAVWSSHISQAGLSSGILPLFSAPPLPAGSSSSEGLLLCFFQSTAWFPVFWPVVTLMYRSLAQMCLCAGCFFFFFEF